MNNNYLKFQFAPTGGSFTEQLIFLNDRSHSSKDLAETSLSMYRDVGTVRYACAFRAFDKYVAIGVPAREASWMESRAS